MRYSDTPKPSRAPHGSSANLGIGEQLKGGWGPWRLSHPVFSQTCSPGLGFESVLETTLSQTGHFGSCSISLEPREMKGNWVVRLPKLVLLICWEEPGYLKPAGLTPDSRALSKSWLEPWEKGRARGFRKGKQEMRKPWWYITLPKMPVLIFLPVQTLFILQNPAEMPPLPWPPNKVFSLSQHFIHTDLMNLVTFPLHCASMPGLGALPDRARSHALSHDKSSTTPFG